MPPRCYPYRNECRRLERTTDFPWTTLPKTVCLPFKCGDGYVFMKNWEPLVLGPELAIARLCIVAKVDSSKFSSSNLSPKMDSPPRPTCSSSI
ncbi:hypothetical protein WICPIJ_005219 [Wickerhamomyces pijperi]|uniref:Uncharacterized protein n=1 Tax=Wickerhamomyces pijperi TaxID=599730 RepID=A0A9P8Q6G0_WICPI|nr:hypothetical protein WICPIJ_005219 [Wickerhamomyces pijperi]